jgi:hypothetical protein
MSKGLPPDWFFLLVAAGAFALSWLAARLDRLGKQLEAISASVREEMAKLHGDGARAHEIVREWQEDRAWQKKNIRPRWMIWAGIGAASLAGWWFT